MAKGINVWTDLTCPDDCADVLLYNAIAADQRCGIRPKLSQITDLFFTPDGGAVPFTISGATATAVANAIDNTVADNSKTFQLYGKGGIDAPEEIPYEAPEGATIVTAYIYTVNFEVVPTEIALYNWLRKHQCGGTDFTFGYANQGGHLFYETDGIKPLDIRVNFVYGAGATDFEVANIVLRFKTENGDPRRFANPLV